MSVQNQKDAQYDSFYALRRRTSSNGLAVMPVAASYPTPAVVVALHGGLEFDIIAYAAIRRGAPPVVPAPYSSNRNRVFLKGEQSGTWSMPDLGGALNYVTGGWYIFAILAPEGLESDFLLGTVPFPGADPDDMIPGSTLSYQQINQRQIQPVRGTNGSQNQVPNLSQELMNIINLQRRAI